jgi:multicomponent Na+:H+ antiporter subunit G
MPDLFIRLSATSKSSTLGVGCILLAVAIDFNDLGITCRALAIIIFVFLTTPVAAHRIARAAYFVGVPLWEGTKYDELQGRYDLNTHVCTSPAGLLIADTQTDTERPS